MFRTLAVFVLQLCLVFSLLYDLGMLSAMAESIPTKDISKNQISQNNSTKQNIKAHFFDSCQNLIYSLKNLKNENKIAVKIYFYLLLSEFIV